MIRYLRDHNFELIVLNALRIAGRLTGWGALLRILINHRKSEGVGFDARGLASRLALWLARGGRTGRGHCRKLESEADALGITSWLTLRRTGFVGGSSSGHRDGDREGCLENNALGKN